ncbi:hypothetical protein D6833_06050, partial [Candidatus Parcubacteria bacterium]
RTNGCELAMNDENCGSCGFSCGAHAICDAGSCACLQGWGNCVDGWGDGCETDLSSTVDHCGNCSTNCNSLNNVAEVSCIDGSCRINSCDAQYGNCDGVTENGCEEDLWVTDSCGTTCDNRVDCNAEIEHGNGVFCNQGSCDYEDCGICMGFYSVCYRDCDGDRSNGCETDIYDDMNCRKSCTIIGSGMNCLTSVENANNPVCRGGTCTYESCYLNFGDCDGDTTNGCETYLLDNEQYCGDCNTTCDDASLCENGTCIRKVKKVAAGGTFTCAVLWNDRVKCWGANGFGQLGLGDRANRGDDPNEMGDNLPYVDLGTGRTVKEMCAGSSHACAILDNDRVKCWGYNAYGQLGLGNTNNRGDDPNEMGNNLPYVSLGSGITPLQITCGGYHTCVRFDNGRVKCWGRNNYGQLGLGDTNNRGDNTGEMGDFLPFVDLGTGITTWGISSGRYHNCAVTSGGSISGKVKCWGYNYYGQLGIGDTQNRGDGPGEMGNNLPIVNFGGTNDLTLQVLSGGYHNCVYVAGKGWKCWGRNDYGQLGLGDTNHRGDSPSELGTALPYVNMDGPFVLGRYHSCSYTTNYTRCWGYNAYGQLGYGHTNNLGDDPGEVRPGMSRPDLDTAIDSIVLGAYHSCVITPQNRLKCWGANFSGVLGLGDTNHRGDQTGEMGANLPYIDY